MPVHSQYYSSTLSNHFMMFTYLRFTATIRNSQLFLTIIYFFCHCNCTVASTSRDPMTLNHKYLTWTYHILQYYNSTTKHHVALKIKYNHVSFIKYTKKCIQKILSVISFYSNEFLSWNSYCEAGTYIVHFSMCTPTHLYNQSNAIWELLTHLLYTTNQNFTVFMDFY